MYTYVINNGIKKAIVYLCIYVTVGENGENIYTCISRVYICNMYTVADDWRFLLFSTVKKTKDTLGMNTVHYCHNKDSLGMNTYYGKSPPLV